MKRFFFLTFSLCSLLLLTSCENNNSIVSSIDEKEANEIVVYLASKGIQSFKIQAPPSEAGGGSSMMLYDISVPSDHAVDAMAILNKAGLPRRKGTNLLQLFAKQGLMSSDREETIRYQAGLAEELKNTIRKIDGVLDADVQISFPPSDASQLPGTVAPKITAAVYIKHQGVLDDPNNHLDIKIKRLMAGSVNGLSYDNVAVISDRSRFTDIALTLDGEPINQASLEQAYVKIWGLILTKSSLTRFRFIFFTFLFFLFLLMGALGWMVYKFYPSFRKSILEKEKPPEES